MNPITRIQKHIDPLRQDLLHHPVYEQLQSLADLNIFMEHHIFTVWNFMSLLKALQRELTCVEFPWVPRGSPVIRKLINEIVLIEETDLDQDGRPASRYELYLDAMEASGADTSVIKDLIREISFGKSMAEALHTLTAPPAVKAYVAFSFDIITRGKVHEIASLFTFGRQGLLPQSFSRQIEELQERFPEELNQLFYYLSHHLEEASLYEDRAMQMILELCGEDDAKWEECQAAAVQALEHRKALWQAMTASINKRQQEQEPHIFADNPDL